MSCALLVNPRAPVRALCVAVLLAFCPSGHTQIPALVEAWSVDIHDTTDSSPALGSDGTIYFGTWSGTFWALTPEGSRKWTFEAGREIRCSPAVAADGTVYFGCRNRKVFALHPSGKLKWAFKTGGWVDASPALSAQGAIYVGAWDGLLHALGADGVEQWRFATGGPVVSSAAIDAGGKIYFGSHDHKFYALTPQGQKAWEFATGGPIRSSPAIAADGSLYFTSVDGFFYALNPDGTLRWRRQTGGITESSPVIGLGGVVYVGVNKALWAMDSSGRKKWDRLATTDEFQMPVEAAPVALADGSVWLISRYGFLANVEGDGPSKRGSFVGSQGYASPAVGPTGMVYLGGMGTNFFAFNGAVPLAPTSWPRFRGNPQNTGRVASGSP